MVGASWNNVENGTLTTNAKNLPVLKTSFDSTADKNVYSSLKNQQLQQSKSAQDGIWISTQRFDIKFQHRLFHFVIFQANFYDIFLDLAAIYDISKHRSTHRQFFHEMNQTAAITCAHIFQCVKPFVAIWWCVIKIVYIVSCSCRSFEGWVMKLW